MLMNIADSRALAWKKIQLNIFKNKKIIVIFLKTMANIENWNNTKAAQNINIIFGIFFYIQKHKKNFLGNFWEVWCP